MNQSEMIDRALRILEDSNDQMMHLSQTIAANADAARHLLMDLIHQPAQPPLENMEDKMKTMAQKPPGQKGIHVIQIDPFNPIAFFQTIEEILKNIDQGGNGYE
jgi:phage-related protein